MSDETEKPPTEDEVREAAALARALDGAPAEGSPAPVDALEAAALLSVGTHPMELDSARSAAILAGLQRQVRPPAPRHRWARAAAGLVSIAAAALLLLGVPLRRPEPGPPRELPRAPPALVAAQLAAIRKPAEHAADLDRELHQYRETLYAELERRHGGGR